MKAEQYDNDEYAYSEVFWGKDQNREYEHEADKLAVQNAIKNQSEWIVDLGGGFGRLVPVLKTKGKNILIVDSSIDLLREAKAHYGSDSSIHYLRANVYHLPFRNLSVEQAVCLRVMHHIEDPDLFFREMNRVVNKRLYLEFPNKKHFLQQIRFYFKQDNTIDIFSMRPEIRDRMFLNFTLRFMRNHILRESIFSVERIAGVSFLRQKDLKKLPLQILLALENVLQRIPFFAEWAPSILLTLSKPTAQPEAKISSLEEMLMCPSCQTTFTYTDSGLYAMCENKHSFSCTDGIWDLFVE